MGCVSNPLPKPNIICLLSTLLELFWNKLISASLSIPFWRFHSSAISGVVRVHSELPEGKCTSTAQKIKGWVKQEIPARLMLSWPFVNDRFLLWHCWATCDFLPVWACWLMLTDSVPPNRLQYERRTNANVTAVSLCLLKASEGI